MKLTVVDGSGVAQTIIVNGVIDAITDRSAVIAAADAPQLLMAANPDRGGCYVQNLTDGPLLLSEISDADAPVVDPAKSWSIAPLACWPPANYPVTLGQVCIQSGQQNGVVVAREW